MWTFAVLAALAQDGPAPTGAAPPGPDPFLSGRGIALGGLAMGIAGNVIGAIGTVRSIPEIDPETGALSPEGFEVARPYRAIGGVVLHGFGGPVTNAGALKMRQANQRAGATHTAAWGGIGLGLGIASALSGMVAFGVDSPTDLGRQELAGAVSIGATASGAASYTFGLVQYVIGNANRPGDRRPVEPATPPAPGPRIRASLSAGPGRVGVVGTW